MVLTLTYGFFVIFFFLLYWWVVPGPWRKYALLVGSVGFFLSSFLYATLLLMALTVIVYGLGRMIALGESRRKWPMVAGVLLTLGVLSYYKYTPWFLHTFNQSMLLLQYHTRVPIPELAIPLGISFFTFKFIHYLVDIYRGDIKETSFLQFALYMMFFPTLSSGPIERYQPFQEQTKENLSFFRKEYLSEGIFRILIGLFKKVVIADAITPFSDGLQNPSLSALSYWIAAYACAIKIYMDFSGYSDIAIGTAKLFGYRIIENFHYPYFQRNLSQFWRHWHMSLTQWFRDYLFIPLGGSRVGAWKGIRNILIVWMATGIWHGSAWHFIFWGLFHAAGLIALKYYTQWIYPYIEKRIPDHPAVAAFSGLFTFHYVVIGWVFFFCEFDQSFHVIERMLLLHKLGG